MPSIPVLGNLSPLIPAGSDVDATLAFSVQKLGFTTRYTQGEPTDAILGKSPGIPISHCLTLGVSNCRNEVKEAVV